MEVCRTCAAQRAASGMLAATAPFCAQQLAAAPMHNMIPAICIRIPSLLAPQQKVLQ